MRTRGLYRTKMPESGAEYARVFYRSAFPPGEIPRPLYEARGYKPRFDTLPTKGEGEVSYHVEAGIREEAYTAIYNYLSDLGLLGANDESFSVRSPTPPKRGTS
jgi:hypothetical protein